MDGAVERPTTTARAAGATANAAAGATAERRQGGEVKSTSFASEIVSVDESGVLENPSQDFGFLEALTGLFQHTIHSPIITPPVERQPSSTGTNQNCPP